MKNLLKISLLLNILFGAAFFWLLYKYADKIMQRIPSEQASILFLGDSILAQENWSKWLGRLDVSNQAYGGAITQQIRWNIENGYPEKTKIVILNGGINDLFSGVPVSRILENYQTFIRQAHKQSIKVIINSCIYTEKQPKINAQVQTLNEGLKRLCVAEKVAYCDINQHLTQDGFLKPQFSLDGLHLKRDAYTIWTALLKAEL